MMFLDTNFLIELERELLTSVVGRARRFLTEHRNEPQAVSVIAAGELAAGLEDNEAARQFLSKFRVASLKPEIAFEAAAIDREFINGTGERFGENDTWIAGFARYYGVALVSNDRAFTPVPGLRVLAY